RELTPKERMRIPRQAMQKQPGEARISNFDEVSLGFDEQSAITEAERCLLCKKPTCMDGCPIRVQIPDFIELIAEGDFPGAAAKIKEDNPLPAVCGRVCPQESLCEAVCVLTPRRESVAIGRLERFAADYDMIQGNAPDPRIVISTGKRVAIVGSGPAGLACATELAKLGHEVTVYEALHELGGVLVYGIPAFRLPKHVLGEEIESIMRMGVRFENNFVVGRTLPVESLMDSMGYDAVFIGTGAGLPRFMDIPGENINGVYSANEFLTRVNLMKAHDFPRHDTPVKLARTAVVVGGGNTAMDAVRSAKRLGAERATILYRRSPEEMPARTEEIRNAEAEGIELMFLTAPVRYLADKDGWLKSVECIRLSLGEPDESGRRRPVPIEGSEFTIETEMAVVAIGNGSNPLIGKTTPGLGLNRWGNIEADPENGRTSLKGVFAGGDIVTGGATVISAMGAGRTVAGSMNSYFNTGIWDEA
ncbi:MAG: NADPH-dependent glutamate synthase, partial [Candidatus Neomarinimicrobiota bacterium]